MRKNNGLETISLAQLERLEVTRKTVRNATKPTAWDLGNKVLYDLCRNYPTHEKPEMTIAKVWLIGRAYAAAIERGAKDAGNLFYENRVGPGLTGKIDRDLEPLRRIKSTSDYDLTTLMKVFCKTNALFKNIARKERRSLSSKYLHFHFPDLFYLYDSRAMSQIRQLTASVGTHFPSKLSRNAFDPVYTRFYLRCLNLVRSIEAAYDILLTPRQLDNLLLKRHSDLEASMQKRNKEHK